MEPSTILPRQLARNGPGLYLCRLIGSTWAYLARPTLLPLPVVTSFERESSLWVSLGYRQSNKPRWIYTMFFCVFVFASFGWRGDEEFLCPWKILPQAVYGQIHSSRKNSEILIVPPWTIAPLGRISERGLVSTSGILDACWSSTVFVAPCGMGVAVFVTGPTGFCKDMLSEAKLGQKLRSLILINSVPELRVLSITSKTFSN